MPTTTKLPYGLGSIAQRGRIWWLIYRDAKGKRIQESAGTTDQTLALYLLAVRGLGTLAARSYEIEKIVKAAAQKLTGDPDQEPARDGGGPTGRRRSVPKYEKGHRKGTK